MQNIEHLFHVEDFMCRECGRIYCAKRCPNYGSVSAARGKRLRRCARCGQGIYETETYQVNGRLAICEFCLLEENKKDVNL